MASSKSPSGGSRAAGRARSSTRSSTRRAETNPAGDGVSALTEQLVNRIIKPLGLVVLSRDRVEQVDHHVDTASHNMKLSHPSPRQVTDVSRS